MRSHTQAILKRLQRFESRNITFIDPDGGWPIVWARAQGNFVWDAEGRQYVDLTGAFGVAAAGHANPRVVRAGQRQMATLLHAMGDVHPHALKAQLAQELSGLTFERWSRGRAQGLASARRPRSGHGKTIFCNSGFEAVEAALKTALLATGRPGVITFRGGYHGLGYGALNATHRDLFRRPFLEQLGQFGHFVDFPSADKQLDSIESAIQELTRTEKVGAILVEPLQTRGGINVPPPGFLPLLRRLGDEHEIVLIFDEIYTGFGRTGKWFGCEHTQVIPDLICVGKALTGGFPLSACVGRAGLMDAAWPASMGEAIHTSTFLGHPVGCAMALAQIQELRKRHLPERAKALGQKLLKKLLALTSPPGLQLIARGLGLLTGLEVTHADGSPATERALGVIKGMLKEGFILLPEGEHGNVIAFTPPLTITEKQLDRAVAALKYLLNLS